MTASERVELLLHLGGPSDGDRDGQVLAILAFLARGTPSEV
jgi:hypothetical protein